MPLGDQVNLGIFDIMPEDTYCGESGAVVCNQCSTWSHVLSTYYDYLDGQASWNDVINCYNQYLS